ncbi:MAG: polyphosphate kinase 1 [Clostridia bacterium]|nr:polyphosphate kinase 1 [Clostridia bacterium]
MYQMYENRELSWLKFNERVLDEATDSLTPPLEKLRFLSIVTSNLDEFYMVRVGSLTDHVQFGKQTKDDKSGLTEAEQVAKVLKRTQKFYTRQEAVYESVLRELSSHGFRLLKPNELTKDQLSFVKDYYQRAVEPLLSPQVVDARQPFLHLENRAVYTALHLKKKEKSAVAFVLKSSAVPNLIELPGSKGLEFVLTDDVIHFFSKRMFFGYEILETCLVKVTRNADLETLEDWYDQDVDYRDMMKDILKKRVRLAPVRIEISNSISKEFKKLICHKSPDNIVLVNKVPLSYAFFSEAEKRLPKDLREQLSFSPVTPQLPGWYRVGEKLLDRVQKEDLFLSYPYDSTKPFFQLLEEAVDDPDVISLKVTLYRLSSNSRIISLLEKAAEKGKEVLVVMELRARFDEANNINYSEQLEQAGVRLLYGLSLYKIHSKILLITKKTDRGVSHIVHLGTGNYNEKTAQLYTDMNLITTHPGIGEDAAEFFNNIMISNTNGKYKHLLVSPFGISRGLCDFIDDEIKSHKEHGDGHIVMKFNSLTSKAMIDKLAQASKAGVRIDLIVRGICCLIPGIPGETENITVTSVVGRYLEHSRIYYFHHHGDEKFFISSADLMTRNLERRLEIATPVYTPVIKQKLKEHLDSLLADDVKARQLQSDGRYVRKPTIKGFHAQEYFMERAVSEAAQVEPMKNVRKIGFFGRLFRWCKRKKG